MASPTPSPRPSMIRRSSTRSQRRLRPRRCGLRDEPIFYRVCARGRSPARRLRTAMIIVHGIIPVRPDSREQALDMARRMSEATQAEPGCISYDFYVGLSDPNSLMLFQEWETMEA